MIVGFITKSCYRIKKENIAMETVCLYSWSVEIVNSPITEKPVKYLLVMEMYIFVQTWKNIIIV